MSTETLDKRAAHRRSVLVTTIACLGGVAAGVLSGTLASGPSDTFGLIVLIAVTMVELGAMRVAGVDVGDFSPKDHLFVLFMTFSLWFITWGILLTSHTV